MLWIQISTFFKVNYTKRTSIPSVLSEHSEYIKKLCIFLSSSKWSPIKSKLLWDSYEVENINHISSGGGGDCLCKVSPQPTTVSHIIIHKKCCYDSGILTGVTELWLQRQPPSWGLSSVRCEQSSAGLMTLTNMDGRKRECFKTLR